MTSDSYIVREQVGSPGWPSVHNSPRYVSNVYHYTLDRLHYLPYMTFLAILSSAARGLQLSGPILLYMHLCLADETREITAWGSTTRGLAERSSGTEERGRSEGHIVYLGHVNRYVRPSCGRMTHVTIWPITASGGRGNLERAAYCERSRSISTFCHNI